MLDVLFSRSVSDWPMNSYDDPMSRLRHRALMQPFLWRQYTMLTVEHGMICWNGEPLRSSSSWPMVWFVLKSMISTSRGNIRNSRSRSRGEKYAVSAVVPGMRE